jgi:hypothetical protein
MDEAVLVVATEAPPPLKGQNERAIVLHTLQERMKMAKKVAKRGRLGAIICGALGLTWFLLFTVSGLLEMRADPDCMYIVLAGVLIGAPFVAVAMVMRARQREAESDIRDLEIETDLLSFPIPPRQVRAERLFRRNEYELLKYYSLNLRQSRTILAIGISCIAAGLGVVGLTFWAVLRGSTLAADPNAAIWMQAIVGVVGAISAVLVNFVAAVYLKIHSENATALSGFHERLVGSNNLFLANLLVARIDNEPEREKTLAEMALQLSKK